MSDDNAGYFDSHARWYADRLCKLTEAFRSKGADTDAVLQQTARIWPQIESAFAWAAANSEGNESAATTCVRLAGCADPSGGNSPLDLLLGSGASRRWAESGLQAARCVRDKSHEAAFLYHLASLSLFEGDYLRSEEQADLAERLFHEVGSAREEGICLNLAGIAKYARGDAAGAVSVLTTAVAIFEALGDPQDTAISLGLLANALRIAKRADEALSCSARALAIFREAGDTRNALSELRTIAQLHADLGNHDEARRTLDSAKELLDAVAPVHAVCASHRTIFELLKVVLNVPADPAAAKQDLVRFRCSGNWLGEGFTLLSLGLLALRNQANKEAANWFDQAHSVFSKFEYEQGLDLVQRYMLLVNSTRKSTDQPQVV